MGARPGNAMMGHHQQDPCRQVAEEAKKELQFRCQRFNLDGSETWSSYDQRY